MICNTRGCNSDALPTLVKCFDHVTVDVVPVLAGKVEEMKKKLEFIRQEAEFCLSVRPNGGEWRESMQQIVDVMTGKLDVDKVMPS